MLARTRRVVKGGEAPGGGSPQVNKFFRRCLLLTCRSSVKILDLTKVPRLILLFYQNIYVYILSDEVVDLEVATGKVIHVFCEKI
jgi:hypothetical protein